MPKGKRIKIAQLRNQFILSKSNLPGDKLDGYTLNRIRKHFKKGVKVWEYDLATKKWTYKTRYDTPP